MDPHLLARLKDLAIQQGNRLQLIYCPHTPQWTVTLGLFTSDADIPNDAMENVIDKIDAYRTKQSV